MNENVKKSLIRGVTLINGMGYMDVSDLPDDIISSSRGVIVTLNGAWGSAAVVNAALEKTAKRIYIKINTDAGTYTISFAVLLI